MSVLLLTMALYVASGFLGAKVMGNHHRRLDGGSTLTDTVLYTIFGFGTLLGAILLCDAEDFKL
jgi:hypothetical protein